MSKYVGCRTTLVLGALAIVVTSSAGAAPASVANSKAPLAARGGDLNSQVTVNQILNRWEPIAAQAGMRNASWREVYATQLSLMAPMFVQMLDALKPGATDAKADYARFAQMFVNAQATAANQPGKAPTKLGSPTTDLVFIPITPCRIVDTRNVGGPITAGTQRSYNYYDDLGSNSWAAQGGISGTTATACPGTVLTPGGGTLGTIAPAAAAATVTVVSPTAAGNFVVWGGGVPVPNTSVLNWTAGQVLANTTVIPWGGRGGGGIQDFSVSYNGPSGQADVVIDVVGYYVENTATALQCQTMVAGAAPGSLASGSALSLALPSCSTGYTRTGGGCSVSATLGPNVYLQEYSPSSLSDCVWFNNSGSTIPSNSIFHTESICCRVPGQ